MTLEQYKHRTIARFWHLGFSAYQTAAFTDTTPEDVVRVVGKYHKYEAWKEDPEFFGATEEEPFIAKGTLEKCF